MALVVDSTQEIPTGLDDVNPDRVIRDVAIIPGGKMAFTVENQTVTPTYTTSTYSLFIEDLATGAIQAIDTPGGAVASDYEYLTASPDGSKISYSVTLPGESDSLYVTDLASGATTRVIRGNGWPTAFSADGTKIFFHSFDSALPGYNAQGNIYMQDLTTGAITLVGGTLANGASVQGGDNFSISADGSKIAFEGASSDDVSTHADGGIFVMDMSTGTVTCVSTTQDGRQLSGSDPILSPDGSKVSFVGSSELVGIAQSPGSTSSILIKDMVTGQLTLADVKADVGSGSETGPFSPDSTMVSFLVGDGNASGAVYMRVHVEKLATGESIDAHSDASGTLLPDTGEYGGEFFSPDNSKIMFTSTNVIDNAGDERADIYIKDLITGSLSDIFQGVPGNFELGTLHGVVPVGFVDNETVILREPISVSPFDIMPASSKDGLFLVHFHDDGIVEGSMNSDVLHGDDLNNTIYGGAGDDTIYGGKGHDKLIGDDGNDTLSGYLGNDVLTGGAGDDTLLGQGGNDRLTGGDGDDELLGGDGNDIEYGSAGNDFISGQAGDDRLYGGAGNDTIRGGDGNDELHGSSGNDDLRAGTGNDLLYGESGDDALYGEDGDDLIYGGAGLNRLYGGAGADGFCFDATSFHSNAKSIIRDFSLLQGDYLKLDQVLSGFNPLQSSIADFVSLRNVGTNTVLSVDRDGTGTAFVFQDIARIDGVTGLSAQSLFDSGHLIVISTDS